MKSWLEISEERLKANYRVLADAAGGNTTVLAVIKANAYGHGAAICAPMLARAGCTWFGVTDAAEGETVLKSLLSLGSPEQATENKVATADRTTAEGEVLIMSGMLRHEAEAIVRLGLVPVVWTREHLEWLREAAAEAGVSSVRVHLEIDTGMARQGVEAGAKLTELLTWWSDQDQDQNKAQPTILLDGIMTHFASSEVAGSPQTAAQRRLFEQAVETVRRAGLHPRWVHAGSSSSLDNQAERESCAWLSRLAAAAGASAMVRTGIALYGYCLPIAEAKHSDEPEQPSYPEHPSQPTSPRVRPRLRPVMTWKTRVIGLRDVHPRDTIGYNAIFSAQRPMRLALLPVGYADGLRRELSGSDVRAGGWVMVHGQRASIVGRVSMNLTIVDVTEISGVAVGDEVIVLGDGVSADDHAALAHTIAYEIVCGVRSNPK